MSSVDCPRQKTGIASLMLCICLVALSVLLPGHAFAEEQSKQNCRPGVTNRINSDIWTSDLFNLDELHKISTGRNVTVAVIDSGVDSTNPHLTSAVVPGTDLVGKGDGRIDHYGHGTAVAGIIAARHVDGSSVIGIAPDAQILPIRIYDSISENEGRRTGSPNLDDIAKGIRLAVAAHAQVINISMSDTTVNDDLRSAVQEAQDHGALIVASGGNRLTAETTADTVRYPAGLDGVIGVSAVDRNLQPGSDSIHGAQIDVAAPGTQVAATIPGGLDCVFATEEVSSSFATAYASGEAALIASAYPGESPAQWRERMLESSNRGQVDARNDATGWGVIDPYSALTMDLGDGLRGPEGPYQPYRQVIAGESKAIIISSSTDGRMNIKRITQWVIVLLVCLWPAIALARNLRHNRRTDVGSRAD